MAISTRCVCGKKMWASDELAGQTAQCTLCGRPVAFPVPYAVATLEPEVRIAAGHLLPAVPVPEGTEESEAPPEVEAPAPPPPVPRSVRDYVYWLLLATLVPLTILTFQGEPPDFYTRLDRTVKAHPELRERVNALVDAEDTTLDDLLAILPGHRLDADAYLPRGSPMHWLYAFWAAVGFFALVVFFFPQAAARSRTLFLVGLFTGTVGVLILFVLHEIGDFLQGRVMISGTYLPQRPTGDEPQGPSFMVSFGLLTLGVGLFEELCKAIPLLWMRHFVARDWRRACVWGLASGAGFGISEGIAYSGELYNGVDSAMIYLVRFASCVALHAMWTASVGITLCRCSSSITTDVEAALHGDLSWHAIALPVLQVLGIAMVLHGLYDTFLERELDGFALVVAAGSFTWLAWQIESRREEEQQEAARFRAPSRSQLLPG